MKPKIQFRRNTKGQYEAFHILTKFNGKKVKIYEVDDDLQVATRKLRRLLAPLYETKGRPETAYKICK